MLQLSKLLHLVLDLALGSHLTLCVQAVHHRVKHIKFVLNRKVDKVRVNKNVIWRTQLCVMWEEKCRWRFDSEAHYYWFQKKTSKLCTLLFLHLIYLFSSLFFLLIVDLLLILFSEHRKLYYVLELVLIIFLQSRILGANNLLYFGEFTDGVSSTLDDRN